MLVIDVSYAAPQGHRIANVALHWEYSPGVIFFNPKGGSNSIMSKTNTRITPTSKIRLSRGYVKQG
jgi:hypothetical protein